MKCPWGCVPEGGYLTIEEINTILDDVKSIGKEAGLDKGEWNGPFMTIAKFKKGRPTLETPLGSPQHRSKLRKNK